MRAYIPRELAGGGAPPVLEVELVGAAVLLAVELRLHEGAARRVVHRQRVVVHPAALEHVARRHPAAGVAPRSVLPRVAVPRLRRRLVPDCQGGRGRARRGGACMQRAREGGEEEEA